MAIMLAVNRLLLLCIGMVAACSPSSSGTPASSSNPAPGSNPAPSSNPTGATIELSSRDRHEPQTIHVGDTLAIKLRDSAQGIAPEYRYGWGTPAVKGEGLEFAGRKTTNPPADVDGGSPRERFEFRATAPGQATITIPVESAGEEASATEFVVSVTVTARP